MDLVRSCYSRNIRYVNGDPTQKAVVTWYRSASTAKVFPGPHAFGSANWDTVHPTPTILGDQDGDARKWYSGKRINRSDGRTFAGPLDFFLNGADAPAPLTKAFDGTPIECLRPPFGKMTGGSIRNFAAGRMGKKTGGSVSASTPTVTIPACGSTGIPTILSLDVSSAAPCACINGTTMLTWNASYTGGGLVPAGAWVGHCTSCGGNFDYVLFDNGSGQLELYMLNSIFQGGGFFATLNSCSPFDVTVASAIPPLVAFFCGFSMPCGGIVNFHAHP